MKHSTLWFVYCVLIASAGACQHQPRMNRSGHEPSPEIVADRTDAKAWFHQAKYGVCVLLLGEGPGWNEQVNRFDVTAFADEMSRAGAGYVLLTLGQNSGHYCAPNATYDKYTGYKAGQRCSIRDLPMELADALNPHGIKLFLYCTARAPQNDAQARAGLAEIADIITAPSPQEFTRRWSEVIREWSLRYGSRLAGWWFDGAYTTGGWDDLTQPYNWRTWADAARAGNLHCLLAFNKGTSVQDAFGKLTDQQDYTAGERNGFDLLPENAPAPPGLQWHLFAYLGEDWGKAGGPAKSDQWMIDYVRRVNEQGGVITFDVSVVDGRVHEPHLRQLCAIRKGITDMPGYP